MGWWDPVRSNKGLDQSHRSRAIGVNYVCFQAVQFEKNHKTGDFNVSAIEQGHLGPNVYPGSGIVLNGGFQTLTVPAYLGAVSSRV